MSDLESAPATDRPRGVKAGVGFHFAPKRFRPVISVRSALDPGRPFEERHQSGPLIGFFSRTTVTGSQSARIARWEEGIREWKALIRCQSGNVFFFSHWWRDENPIFDGARQMYWLSCHEESIRRHQALQWGPFPFPEAQTYNLHSPICMKFHH